MVGSPQKQAYVLVFEGGRGDGVGKEQPPPLIFKGGCGVGQELVVVDRGGDKEQPPLKMSCICLFSRTRSST